MSFNSMTSPKSISVTIVMNIYFLKNKYMNIPLFLLTTTFFTECLFFPVTVLNLAQTVLDNIEI